MAGHIKYMVSVDHLESTIPGHRKVTYSRVIGIYDDLDCAIQKYLDLTTKEEDQKVPDWWIQEVIDDIKEDEKFFDEKDNFYQYLPEVIHDWPKFYVGPGRYRIDKRRLS